MSAEEEKKAPAAGADDAAGAGAAKAGGMSAGTAKRAKISLNVAIMSVLAVALFGIVNYLAIRWYDRWDWTSDAIYTLSPRSKQVLARVNRRIDVYVFVSRGDPMFADLKELFTRYGAETQRLKVEFVDPDLNPTRFQLLSQRLGVRSGQTPQGQTITDIAIAVSAGDRRWFITKDDLQDVEIGGEEGAPRAELTGFKAEQALTSAIVNVQSSRATKICFTKGHGEWSLSGFGERGLGHIREDMRPDNYETEEIETRGRPEIPRTCDALAVIAPQRPFDETEAGAIKSYVTNGGNLLLALDPVLDRGSSEGRTRMMPSGLEGVARELGVRVDDALVLEADEGHRLNPNLVEVFVATNYGQHPLVNGFNEGLLAFVSARAVRPADGSSATALVTTTDEAWAETDLAGLVGGQNPERGDTDVRGPVPLAVAVEAPAPSGARREGNAGRPRGGRVVVVGDADYLDGEFFQQPRLVNRDFTLATFAWLTQRQELVAIGAKPARSGALNMTEGDLSRLFLYVVVLMPAAALVLGAATWMSRRS